MSCDTAITGIGLITPAGIGVDANWDNVVSARSTASQDPTLTGLPVEISCRVPGFDKGVLDVANPWQWDRFSQFALIATLEALADAGLEPGAWDDDSRVAVIIGSGAGGTSTLEGQHAAMLADGPTGLSPLTLPMGLLNMAAGQVAIELGARGPCMAPCSACAAGASAIGVARDLLLTDRADIVIAGGAEAPITPFYVSAFARMRALSRNPSAEIASRPFDKDRDGFVIGEGAGIFVLETEERAKKRGAEIKSYLAGYGASADASHVTSPHPKGEGAKNAMRAALRDANLKSSAVGYINAHGTSTPGNDVVESAAISEVFGKNTAVSSTKGVTGHLLGAAGPIEFAYSLLALKNQTVPPTASLINPDPEVQVNLVRDEARPQRFDYALCNSFGFGGQNVSLLARR